MKTSYLKHALAIAVCVFFFTSCEKENLDQEDSINNVLPEQLDQFINSNFLNEIETISFDGKTIPLDEITNLVMLEEVENKLNNAYYSLFTENKVYLFSEDQMTNAEFDVFVRNEGAEDAASATGKNSNFFVLVDVWNFHGGKGERRNYKRYHDSRQGRVSTHHWNMSAGFTNKAGSYFFSKSDSKKIATVTFYNFFNRRGPLFSKTLFSGTKEVGIDNLFGGYNNTISSLSVSLDFLK